MNSIPVSDVRNVALMGHTGSGKTSLLDAIMYRLKVNDRLGSVDNGSSLADFTDEEKKRKITLVAKPFQAEYKSDGKTVNMVITDTPGFMDFFGQVIAAARAADSALVVVDASSGIQVGTHRAWRCCAKQGLAARGFVITGIDKENVDFAKTVSEIQAAFGQSCIPVVLPTADAGAVVDVLVAKDVPADLRDRVDEIKNNLVELAAETDDTLIEKFIGGEDLSPDEIAGGLVNSVASGGLHPIFVCVGPRETGVDELLSGVVRLFPSPEARAFSDADDNPIPCGVQDPFVGLVWRSVNDPFVGQLTFVRVLGGTLKSDSEIFNSTRKQAERLGSLLLVNGKQQSPVSEATAGDVVVVPKLKATSVGDTLTAAGRDTVCPAIKFPNPVVLQAVTAKTQADEDRIGTALSRVCEEDPTLKVVRNTETRETVLQGMGDVHIEVAVEMMKRRSNVDVILNTPRVPYRETVTAEGEGRYRHKKQSGGRGQYGEVFLRVAPRQPDDEEWFVNAIVGGAIPGNFVPAVQKGLVEGMATGAVAGYPVDNVKITVYDGSYHDVDSSEIAFKIAGARAFREGMSTAKPVLLEPIMKVDVMVPDQYMGDVNGDLNHKRGRILGMAPGEVMQVITAEVPQAELFRYAAELRSMTGGQGSFEMEFSRYDIVPANVAQKVIDAAKKKDDE